MNWLSTLALAPLIVAQDATRGLVSTEGADVAPGRADYARRHAVVVGIDGYTDSAFPALSRAQADAKAVTRVLRERYGFDDVRLLLEEDATKDGLERALQEWACDSSRIGEEDLVVIYFAGHGVTRTDARGLQHGYLVPFDARSDRRGEPAWSSLLGMRDLEAVSPFVPAKHVLFVLDCCFGGLLGKRSTSPMSPGLANRARQVLTAGGADQEVLDGRGSGHSVFTGAFLDALQGAADTNGDSVITFGELYDHVGATVQHVTQFRQTPQQVSLPDHEGGNVAFFAPDVRPGAQSLPDRVAELERTAEERLEELERFSDALLVRELRDEAEALWPQVPDMAPRYRHWLARARELDERDALHVEALRRLREEAAVELLQRDRLPSQDAGEIPWDDVSLELRWRHDVLVRMLRDFDDLGRLAGDVERRLAVAESLRRRSIEEHAQAWADAVERIREHPSYGGMALDPQLGLVPLGPDPRTGLWEFAHVVTGDVPVRDDADDLARTAATGVVLVLLPGGTFTMGAQADDPDGARFDPDALRDEGPPHEVTLAPFLVSKHELTQAQWVRVAGANPSTDDVEEDPASGRSYDARHPVEGVSREDCALWIARMGLALPTEAQWEYAARAGTDTVWPTGDDPASLAGHANVADLSLMEVQSGVNPSESYDFDDGWYRSAPTGSYAPNRFGLCDTIGNVMEWVRDALVPYDVAPRPGTGLRSPPRADALGVVRGAAHDGGPFYGRSACRVQMPPGARLENLGVRPVCPIR